MKKIRTKDDKIGHIWLKKNKTPTSSATLSTKDNCETIKIRTNKHM